MKQPILAVLALMFAASAAFVVVRTSEARQDQTRQDDARVVQPGGEIRSWGATSPAEARVMRGRRGGGAGERDYVVRLHKPAGTAFDRPAEAVVVEGEPTSNGRDATGPVVQVTRGVAFARGWRPIIRTPRTTTVAPGSCIAVEVDLEIERVYLIESDSAQVWLNSNSGEVVELRARQYVEIVGNESKHDFVRDDAGAVRIYAVDSDDAGRRLVGTYKDEAR